MDKTAIEKVLGMYFDASFESDPEKMDLVFRPEAHIYRMQEGRPGIVGSTRDEFITAIGSMPAEERASWKRSDTIHFIEFTSEVTAVAKVSLRVRNLLYSDILNFVYDDGRWQVSAKLAYGAPCRD